MASNIDSTLDVFEDIITSDAFENALAVDVLVAMRFALVAEGMQPIYANQFVARTNVFVGHLTKEQNERMVKIARLMAVKFYKTMSPHFDDQSIALMGNQCSIELD